MENHIFDTGGYQEKQNHIRNLIILPALEVIENIYQGREYKVKLTTSELSTICPKTGLPDFAVLTISYLPDQFLVEEKSLKLYLTSYRNLGIYQEHATNKILEDFVAKINPLKANITATWNNRGGIGVTVENEWSRDKGYNNKI